MSIKTQQRGDACFSPTRKEMKAHISGLFISGCFLTIKTTGMLNQSNLGRIAS